MIPENLQNGFPLIASDFNSLQHKKEIKKQWDKGPHDCPMARCVARELPGIGTTGYNTVTTPTTRFVTELNLDEIYRCAKELRKGAEKAFIAIRIAVPI